LKWDGKQQPERHGVKTKSTFLEFLRKENDGGALILKRDREITDFYQETNLISQTQNSRV